MIAYYDIGFGNRPPAEPGAILLPEADIELAVTGFDIRQLA